MGALNKKQAECERWMEWQPADSFPDNATFEQELLAAERKMYGNFGKGLSPDGTSNGKPVPLLKRIASLELAATGNLQEWKVGMLERVTRLELTDGFRSAVNSRYGTKTRLDLLERKMRATSASPERSSNQGAFAEIVPS